MHRRLLAALWLCLWPAGTLVAQTVADTVETADVLLVDHDFAALGELVRTFLNDKQVYRAELSSKDVTLEIRPRIPGMRTPRLYEITNSTSPSGTSVVEIYPDQDGEYELRPISLHGSRLPSRLRLYRDVSESRRRVAALSKPGWELGIEVAGGWHSGFNQSSVAPTPGSSPDAGSDLEACLSARNAPGIPRLNMCVFGLSHQSQRGAPNILWVYTEPRVRLFGRAQPGASNWELGALLRFGVGMMSGVSETPTILGPGVYVARHIRRNSAGSGWSLQASYSRAFFRGFSRSVGVGPQVTPASHRATFGVGWYQ